MFRKILIANRGEIAVRVIRACRELGISSVAVYSEVDRESLHVRLADEAVCIGPASSRESYLNQEAVLTAAKITDAQAIHPGYGFLAENARFAKACEDLGLVFIGPSSDSIRKLGNKVEARKLAEQEDVPVVPGANLPASDGFLREAERIGFPVLIKASAGGGGKGMRIVREPGSLSLEVEAARSEAKAAFGDPTVYLEKLIERARHVEVQFASDAHGNIVTFTERDCSVQRRHQKLIEESPSPAVDPKTRKRLWDCTRSLARASGYRNVGTAEFLLAPDRSFYFLEVNTRLQVEHPVTEAVAGVDLVAEQIFIAAGKPLSLSPETCGRILCHAIEHRINAEDPERGFLPSPGRVRVFEPPGGGGVRVDTFLYSGAPVPSFYDSLVAKLIAWGPDRDHALDRAKRALLEFRVEGIRTTIPFHLKVLQNPSFRKGEFDTSLAERL